MSIPNADLIYENVSGELGSVMSVAITGHVEDDVAVPIAEALLLEYEVGGPIDRPKRLYMRKVPLRNEDGYTGSWMAQYQTYPQRGASPITLVDLSHGPYRPCALCPWDATTGFPVDRFIDPPKADDRGLVWMCRAHASDFWTRLAAAEKAARKAALLELESARAAS